MQVDDSYDGRSIELAVGEKIELRLPENPTTGFRWRLTSDGGPTCTLVGEAFTASTGPPGAPGEHVWTFTAAEAGECELELRYARPWGPPPEGEKIFKLHVRANG